MYNQDNEKIFFSAGNIVRVKHDIKNKPEMLVQSVDKATFKMPGESKASGLLGVTCIWFTDNMQIQKHRFSTKDLEKC